VISEASLKKKQRVLVIAPGRGTYNRSELGYLQRYHNGDNSSPEKRHLIESTDFYRQQQQQIPVTELDQRSQYSLREHTRGDNASPLIWTCAYADYLSINRDRFEVCAITGNSMGWYIALGCGGGLRVDGALHLINTMGTLMQESLIGGQLIYPLVDEQWQEIPGRRQALFSLMDKINKYDDEDSVFISIYLGGMIVFGGYESALQKLEKELAVEQDRFPMRLHNHAAFHTLLQRPISLQGQASLPLSLFQTPTIPLVDGRGYIWSRFSSDPAQLWDYTLGHQVCYPYDFTRAIQVSVKEFAPDRIIILGPGTTLGGAVAQSLIDIKWRGWETKQDFIAAQKNDPYLITMGMEEQRILIT